MSVFRCRLRPGRPLSLDPLSLCSAAPGSESSGSSAGLDESGLASPSPVRGDGCTVVGVCGKARAARQSWRQHSFGEWMQAAQAAGLRYSEALLDRLRRIAKDLDGDALACLVGGMHTDASRKGRCT